MVERIKDQVLGVRGWLPAPGSRFSGGMGCRPFVAGFRGKAVKGISICSIFAILGGLIFPFAALADPPEYAGGVNNEYQYEEMVFLTGEPVKFTGTLTTTEKEKGTQKTVTYKFNLTDASGGTSSSTANKLVRTVTYITTNDQRNDKGQTIAQTKVDKYSETVTFGKTKYVLKDYQFSKSDVIDNRPASDFYSGNINGRKYYAVNNNQGQVVVDISGGDVGYQNFWGSTDTQEINYEISADIKETTTRVGRTTTTQPAVSWNGTVQVQVSDSMTKSLKYVENQANFSSFDGGYARVTNRDIVSRYQYDLPVFTDGVPSETKRNRDQVELSESNVPRVERLVVPKFRDIGGHWAQDEIMKLYSLDVFDDAQQFFSPDIPMTRSEFITGVVRACNIRASITEPKKTTGFVKKAPPEVSPFSDVPVDDKNYTYIKDALAKGIISGTSAGKFNPKGKLTRAEAVTILIRALGFESKAPAPGYATSFDDDYAIPSWAKDSFYMAQETGLVQGDELNRANPNQVMTRAEASALLVRFLDFLQQDLQKDYRESIVQF